MIMLEVAVIGAGAAGLAAGRHLLAQGIRCCIFEAASTVGGAWKSYGDSSSSCGGGAHNNDDGATPASADTLPASYPSRSSTSSAMWQGLYTNLSKHTCRFSDFPWPSETPTFPSSLDMDRYLTSYAEAYLAPECFLYHCQVTRVAPTSSATTTTTAASAAVDPSSSGYRVEWTDLSSQTQHVKDFGGVVVATGFFSQPRFPPDVVPTEAMTSATSTNSIHVLHAKDYNQHEDFQDEAVVVVGSSFSALEIAVDVSRSAKRVVSVMPYIPWVVPRYVPSQSGNDDNKDNGSSSYLLPVDLALYRRTSSCPSQESTRLTPKECRQRNEKMQQILGGRQLDILGEPHDFSCPPMVAISDDFLDLVADGTIEVVHGRLEQIDDATGVHVHVKVPEYDKATDDQQSRLHVLPDISKVICCTGYRPNLQDYMDESILEALEYDRDDSFAPMTLCWETVHPSLANLAFCGMYRGPYMGVMEQQARLAAGVMSGKVQPTEEQYHSALDTSRGIRLQDPRPSFPHFDYVGFMDTLAGINGHLPRWNTQVGDTVTPAFYQDNDDIAKTGQAEIDREVQKAKDGSHVAETVLSALIGKWKFSRNIVHHSNGHQEYVHGTVRYSRPILDFVKYREDGIYQISETKSVEVFREYEYECRPGSDLLEVFFVEGGKRAHLFLSLKFAPQDSDGKYWVATSDHLCVKDLYKGTFQVKLDGLKATELTISYRVKGPSKDYEATTVMSPQH